MDTFNRNDLIHLLKQTAKPCVSLYMPVEVTGREIRQNPVRLKNLLTQAKHQLTDALGDEDQANRLLRPIDEQLEEKHFWDRRNRGLAVLIDPNAFHIYWLPYDVEESVYVDERYYVRPLLPAIGREAFCYLLALSQSQVRLFRMAENSLDELSAADLPNGIEDALNYASVERGAQVHSSSSVRQGKQAAVFHGHGGKPDAAKDDLSAYCRQVDEVVVREITKKPGPLLLACIENLASAYRNVTHVENLLEEFVGGCSSELSEYQLNEKAWPLWEAELNAQRELALSELKEKLASKTVTADVREIVVAAGKGQIDALYFDPSWSAWGLLQPADGIVDPHDIKAKGDVDLIESAATETILHHGEIHSAPADQLPTASPMVAVLRFA
jgi:hypothetical protein